MAKCLKSVNTDSVRKLEILKIFKETCAIKEVEEEDFLKVFLFVLK